MNMTTGRFALSLIATGIIISANAFAYPQYDIRQSYLGGEKVTDNKIDYGRCDLIGEGQWDRELSCITSL